MAARAVRPHITLSEADASLWALEECLTRPSDCGLRVLHPVDSAAWAGAVAKGRSSSHLLNSRCRGRASIVLAAGTEVFVSMEAVSL
eukprot:3364828-Karenia_brevis.AAC.1